MQVRNNLNQTKSLGFENLSVTAASVTKLHTCSPDGKQSVNAGPHHADDDHPDGHGARKGRGWEGWYLDVPAAMPGELTSLVPLSWIRVYSGTTRLISSSTGVGLSCSLPGRRQRWQVDGQRPFSSQRISTPEMSWSSDSIWAVSRPER